MKRLFEKVKKENNGRLDVLVNNAYAGVDMIYKNTGKKFYELDPVEQWDTINGVGLRNHFLCTTYASRWKNLWQNILLQFEKIIFFFVKFRMMIERKDGLIINISNIGGLKYLMNVPFGIGKAACDRMASDCAIELKNDNITMVSLWPGPVKTEYNTENIINNPKGKFEVFCIELSKI